jgi:hypothetical protein
MRLPTARTQFLAFLVPFLGVTLTFNGTGIAARRANPNQTSRTRPARSLRATVGHEWDVLHEDPDKRWSHSELLPASFDLQIPAAKTAVLSTPIPPPQAGMIELLPPEQKLVLVSRAPSTARGRSPPSFS